MSILGKIKSKLKKVKEKVVKVAKTVKDQFNGGLAAAADALKPKTSGMEFKVGENVPSNVNSGLNTYSGFNAPSGTKSTKNLPTMEQGNAKFMKDNPQYGYNGAPNPTTLKSGSSSTKSNYDNPSYSADLNGYSAFSSSSFMTQAPVSLKVNASNVGTGTAASLTPSSPSPQNYESQVRETNIKGGADLNTGMYTQPAATVDDTQEGSAPKQKTALEQYTEMMDKLERQQPDDSRLYEKAQKQAGFMEAQQRLADTQNQINGVTAKMNQDLLQLRGTAAQEGVTEAVYGGQQAQVTREATIRLLPLQAQLAADQNNFDIAQENTEKLYSMYSKEAERSYNNYKSQIETYYQYATAEEKRKLDDISEEKNFTRNMIKSDADYQRDIATEFLKNGNSAAYRAVSSIRIPTNVTSPTFAEDYQNYKEDLANAAAKYGVQTQTGADAPLYVGLNPSTATAVRQQVGAFKTEPAVQNFAVIQEGKNFASSIADDTENPADDQALIYALAKALDPGSVVREGEYATAQKYAQSWVKAYGKQVSQAIAGTGFLSEEARINIKKTIETKYKSSEKTYDNLLNQYVGGINNLTGRSDGDKFLRDYKISASGGTLTSPDGTQQVDTNDITAEQIEEARNAGWK